MTLPEHAGGTAMRILYVTQWFEPEPIFKGARFARALQDAGHDVQVVTGFPNYPHGNLYPGYSLRPIQRETIEGVRVHRLPLWPSHSQSPLGRIVNYLSFFVSVLFYCLLRSERFDVVYVYHPPLTPGLAVALCGMVRGTPFVLDVQDLWPDSVAASGMANSTIVNILNSLCRFVYKRAAAIACQSQGMLELIAERGVRREKLMRIYNWSNYSPPVEGGNRRAGKPGEDRIPAEIAEAFEGSFNLVYGGNLGQAQALECLIDAAIAARRSDPRIRLHLFGSGIEREKLAERASASTGAVLLHGPVPPDVMDRVFERADALALHLKDEPLFRHTIPSKLQHYISVGRPILAGIQGEGRMMLEECGAARVFDPMDIPAARDAMLVLAELSDLEKASMRKSSKEYYARNLSFENALTQTLEIMDTAAHTSA